jgi:hypothetical protein
MPYAHLQALDAATRPVSSSTNLLGEQCSAAVAKQILLVAMRSCLLGSGAKPKVQQLHQERYAPCHEHPALLAQ